MRRAKRTNYKIEKIFGTDYYVKIRAHHECGHAVLCLHQGLGVEKIVLIGNKRPIVGVEDGGHHEGHENADGFISTEEDGSCEDLWASAVAGPIAEHNIWATWDFPEWTTYELTSGSAGDAADIVDTLERRHGKRKKGPTADEKAIAVKYFSTSLVRILRDNLVAEDDELRDLLGDELAEHLMGAINDARASLEEHADVLIALVNALMNVVPDASGDRILSGTQVQEIWNTEPRSNEYRLHQVLGQPQRKDEQMAAAA